MLIIRKKSLPKKHKQKKKKMKINQQTNKQKKQLVEVSNSSKRLNSDLREYPPKTFFFPALPTVFY